MRLFNGNRCFIVSGTQIWTHFLPIYQTIVSSSRPGVPPALSVPWVGWKWTEPLVMCHWWNSESPSALQSAADQVNSPIRRNAAKATQKAALRVDPSWEEASSLSTRQRRRSRVMGSRSWSSTYSPRWSRNVNSFNDGKGDANHNLGVSRMLERCRY